MSDNKLDDKLDNKLIMKGIIMKIEIDKPTAVETICYGHRDEWESKEKAIEYFSECASASEGSERERYMTIILQLLNGQKVATDGSGK